MPFVVSLSNHERPFDVLRASGRTSFGLSLRTKPGGRALERGGIHPVEAFHGTPLPSADQG